MAGIVSDKETNVIDSEPKFSYDDLQKAYDELLDDSQTLSSHYASLKKLSLEFENLKSKKKKLRHEKNELLKENTLL